MKFKGSSAYDNNDFFEKYSQKRNRRNSPNNVLEKPIIDDLILDVAGKTILELGCGEGKYGKELLERGAHSYRGMDGSSNMIKQARLNLTGLNCSLEKIEIEKFDFPEEQYDLVVSRLVFHYLEDLKSAAEKIYKSLRLKGELVCSVEHPIITSCYDSYGRGKRGNWIVDHYFKSGKRINQWIGKEVVKYHRTFEEYFRLFKTAGFQMEEIRESKPFSVNFDKVEEYERRMRIPLFLLFKLRK